MTIFGLTLSSSPSAKTRERRKSLFPIGYTFTDGSPSNRTVVFRGFVDGSNSIKAITDTRSSKFTEIESNAMCEYAGISASQENNSE